MSGLPPTPDHDPVLSRRRLPQTAAVLGGAAGLGALGGPTPIASGAPALARDRPEVRWGVQSGDVTPWSAVVWSKTDRPARMVVEVAATESYRMPPATGPVAQRRLLRRQPATGRAPGVRPDPPLHPLAAPTPRPTALKTGCVSC